MTLKKAKVPLNFNNIYNISLSSLRENEACHLPVIGTAGLTVIFTQTDHITNFTTTQNTIGDLNYGSVAGGMIILFLNGMEKSIVSITNTTFYSGACLLIQIKSEGLVLLFIVLIVVNVAVVH